MIIKCTNCKVEFESKNFQSRLCPICKRYTLILKNNNNRDKELPEFLKNLFKGF